LGKLEKNEIFAKVTIFLKSRKVRSEIMSSPAGTALPDDFGKQDSEKNPDFGKKRKKDDFSKNTPRLLTKVLEAVDLSLSETPADSRGI
jgi:hypothetical protein